MPFIFYCFALLYFLTLLNFLTAFLTALVITSPITTKRNVLGSVPTLHKKLSGGLCKKVLLLFNGFRSTALNDPLRSCCLTPPPYTADNFHLCYRWNKDVGYCQGFNMLAAIILEVMEKSESDALKVNVICVSEYYF